jgi:outer membrane protein TolC
VRQNVDQLSRVALGLKVPGLPVSTGQFSYQESYLAFSDSGLNVDSLLRLRSARRATEAARFGLEDAREVIVLAVGTAYLQVEASEARLHTFEAQLQVARALEEQTANQVRSGLAPEIDQFRATVQRQTNEQRVTVAQANVDKDKLTLARLIGLPNGQQFRITTAAPYVAWNGPRLEILLQQARQNRTDVKSAQAAAEAASLTMKAAQSERLPGLSLNGYYGRLGSTLSQSDQTYTVAATVSLPLFTGGRIRADVQEASAQFETRQAEYLDLLGRVDYEVRNGFIDLQAAESAVQVADKNSQLAQKTLEQARDRFINGVTNNLEVVQAQQEVAAANENYISSLFAHNLAKLALLRALGTAQKDVTRYLGGN